MRVIDACIFLVLVAPTAGFTDTSSWVGGEYTPWTASNELWWYDYESYKPVSPPSRLWESAEASSLWFSLPHAPSVRPADGRARA